MSNINKINFQLALSEFNNFQLDIKNFVRILPNLK